MAPTPDPFAVTTPAANVALPPERRGDFVVSVTNVSGRPLRARLQLVPSEPAKPEWFSIGGGAEREYALGATQSYTVTATVPKEVPAGTFSVRADAHAEDQPQEVFTTGPTVALTAGPGKAKKRFPWWIIAIIAGAIVLVAIIVFLFTRGGEDAAVPDVVGLPATSAIQALTSADFSPDPDTVDTAQCDPTVQTQDPGAGSKVSGGSTVTLTFGPCVDLVAVPALTSFGLSGATTLANAFGLQVEVVRTLPEGTNCDPQVSGQSPSSGTQVARGSTVIVAVPREPGFCNIRVTDVRISQIDDLEFQTLDG